MFTKIIIPMQFLTLCTLLFCCQLSLAKNLIDKAQLDVVPPNNFLGLADYAGQSIKKIHSSLPIDINKLVMPKHEAYFGMTRQQKIKPLDYHFEAAMSGASAIKSVYDNRYVIFSACRYRSCDEKGWIIIDTKTNEYLAAFIHFFYRNNNFANPPSLFVFTNSHENYSNMPEVFLTSLHQWATNIHKNYTKIRFINLNPNRCNKPVIICKACEPNK